MTRTAIILAAVLLLTLCLFVWREIHHSTRYALEVERCRTAAKEQELRAAMDVISLGAEAMRLRDQADTLKAQIERHVNASDDAWMRYEMERGSLATKSDSQLVDLIKWKR